MRLHPPPTPSPHTHPVPTTPKIDGNNCICSDHCSDESCYAGDVNALIAFGFDAVKVRFPAPAHALRPRRAPA